jgi:hypothetical protein
MIFEPGKNIYFSTYSPPAMDHLSHRFISALKTLSIEIFLLLSKPLPHLRFKLIVSEIFAAKAEQLYAIDTF